jgi:hypothetical protein
MATITSYLTKIATRMPSAYSLAMTEKTVIARTPQEFAAISLSFATNHRQTASPP